MGNQEHLEILGQGVEVWNRWRKENPDIRPKLRGAHLRGAYLIYADLSRADLVRARLSGADLRGADLREADLRGANLRGADLNRAGLRGTDLSGAKLGGAKLGRADLREVHLREARLRRADLREVHLSGADLREAHLREADLRRADLRGTGLSGAKLGRAKLRGADLRGADLRRANLCGADLRRADLRGTGLDQADFSGADLRGAKLNQTVLIGTNFSNADLSNCSVYGIAAWNLNLEGTTQSNLVITPPDEPVITVDNLEVAQFIYLLLHNEKIRHIIDTITSKVVLILGRFTPERKSILDAIRDELRRRDYLPVLFDFEKPGSRDLTETISALAHMARFVIADITDAKSIPAELERIVPGLPSVPVQPLIATSDYEYDMFEHFRGYPWVLDTYQYDSLEDLLASLKERVIDPAESKAKELTSPPGRALVSPPAENPKATAP
jgi:uncharacterized protein YjbI with pentapeptide repeats